VVAHERTTSLAEAGREQVLLHRRISRIGERGVMGHSHGSNAASYASAVRGVINGIDPHLLITDLQTADSVVYRCASGHTIFIALDLGLCGGGGDVGRHRPVWRAFDCGATEDSGDRRAHGFGSGTGNIIRLIVLQGLRLSAAGIAVGLNCSVPTGPCDHGDAGGSETH